MTNPTPEIKPPLPNSSISALWHVSRARAGLHIGERLDITGCHPQASPLLGGSRGLSMWVKKGDIWSYYMGNRGY